MGSSRFRAYRIWAVIALLLSGVLTGLGFGPATADITAVNGSAYGYFASVSLFGGPANITGPTPTIALPAGGSVTPRTSTAASGSATAGPARFFSSDAITVSTQGAPGPTGSVTSSATIDNLNKSGQETLTASKISSTCTASGGTPTGSTTITGGKLQIDSGDDDPANSIPDHAPVEIALPANPTPGQTIEAHLHVNGTTDTFRVILNEQILGSDGTITVNAAHQKLLGPTAVGDVIVGQSICGVTGTAATTTTSGGATTTTVSGVTTTTASSATTTSTTGATTTSTTSTSTTTSSSTSTTVAPTTTTTGGTTGVGGGAYGFYVSVSLFGGAAAARGPVPTVTLPAAGSATPVTATAAEGSGKFGPATIFSSGQLDVSTQGTPGGSVTSSAKVANINTSTSEVLTAASITSTCTASSSGTSGSATVTGGTLITSEGANIDIDEDDVKVNVPANPAPNTEFTGKIETVGDTFRYVFNEQIKNSDGSITVNAAHQYLLGPTAVGELIIGQSRCGVTAAGTGGGGGTTGGGGGGGGGLAGTGSAIAVFFAFALLLVVGGWTTIHWSAGAQWRERVARRMPWSTSGILR